MKIAAVIVVALVLILLLREDDYTYNSEIVTGEVINKEYKEPYTSTRLIPTGKVLVPMIQHHREQYIVIVSYSGMKDWKNDKELYDKVNIGDSIEIEYVEVYDKKGKLIKTYIEIN